jgi:peptidoglycan/xylan/chitin deacetylase (PgdA/CDA1 family)
MGESIHRSHDLALRIWRAILYRAAGSITHVDTAEKAVALTFDDGPHPQFTEQLLDTLDRFNAKATFFVLGTQAAQYPHIIERIKASGHFLGCHSWDHPSFATIGQIERYRQIMRWRNAVGDMKPRLFRPPFGHQTPASYFLLRLLGYRVIFWKELANDWLDKDADWLYAKLEKAVSPGAILLLHDNLFDLLDDRYLDRRPTISAVERLLERFSSEYDFVTVAELLARKGKLRRRLLYNRPDPEFMSRLHRSAPY